MTASAPPPLYPQYFSEILHAGGVPSTEDNFVHLIQRAARPLGRRAAAHFAHAPDPAALELFIANFARGGRPERRLALADDMIRWLWTWQPACLPDLGERIARWRQTVLSTDPVRPPTPLAAPDFEEDWRIAFNHELDGRR